MLVSCMVHEVALVVQVSLTLMHLGKGSIVTEAHGLGSPCHAYCITTVELLLELAWTRGLVRLKLRRLVSNEFRCFKTALILLFQHGNFQVMVALEEAKLVFKTPHSLLRAYILLLHLLGKFLLKLAILFLEDLKDFFFIL